MNNQSHYFYDKILKILASGFISSFFVCSAFSIDNENTPKAPVGISYRYDGEGKGSFYDHYTVQKSTGHQTYIVKSPNIESKFHEFTNQQAFNIPFKNVEITEKLDEEMGGLLFIPGRVREDKSGSFKDRENFESNIIRQAILHGRPILAVCAGSWRLWEAYGGKTKEVKDHNYNGGMIRINENGVITYNVQIHDIKVEPKTLLSSIMGEVVTPVNSVHWLAPDDNLEANDDPKNVLLKVSGRSVENNEVSIKTRQGEIMNPDEDTVESFETSFGSPVIGIQWHPEAYCNYLKDKKIVSEKSQKDILLFMAKAGDSYAAKRRMIVEFKKKFKPVMPVTVVPPTRVTAVPPTRVTAVPPTRVTAVPPTRVTAVPPTRVTAVPPTRVTAVPPTQNEYDLVRSYIKESVKQKRKTQKDWATELSVDQSTISRFLSGKIQSSTKILNNFKMAQQELKKEK